MTTRITILGAGFAGLELSTLLSQALGDKVQVTLIEHGDAFVFGHSKLDVMFGRTTLDADDPKDFHRDRQRDCRSRVRLLSGAARESDAK